MNDITIKNLFDLTEFKYKELFDGVEYPWEVLPRIKEFIASQNISDGKIIDESASIEEGVLIKGSAVIGKNSIIRHGAYIRENVVIGENVIIGHSVELKNCIIMDNTSIAHFNYIGDSVIGKGVNFGAGSKIANVRLDKKNILVKNDSEIINTGLEKFGAAIGDGVQIGVNAVINPGTIIGKKSAIFPLISVIGCYPENSIIR